MDKTKITFYLDGEDRKIIENFAREQRLPTSTFCRVVLLQTILAKEQESQQEAPTQE